jgi:hypothetical protein
MNLESVGISKSNSPFALSLSADFWVSGAFDQRTDFGFTGYAEFVQYMTDVCFHRLGGDNQAFRHFPVGVSGGDEG